MQVTTRGATCRPDSILGVFEVRAESVLGLVVNCLCKQVSKLRRKECI